jgi:hypothetical protein
MNASALRRVLPTRAPDRLVVLLLLIAAVMGLAATVILDQAPPLATEHVKQITAPPDKGLGHIGTPATLIDHSAIDWDRVPLSEPDLLSALAYGN